jgi:sugar phosphate isomerase/epimerase
MNYPEIYLAIDNCFASKRFTKPKEWMQLAADLGVYHVEASADNECDPLYQGADYLSRWVDDVQEASVKTGVSVCNLYSGHGTYSTLGLSHTDPQVRDRMLNQWLKPMAATAGALGAGLGFYCHAFPDSVLQNPAIYQEYYNELIKNLAEIAGYAQEVGCKSIGLEQMYSPHQIPFTIRGANDLIHAASEKAKHPIYITLDSGHASGQRNFLKPDKATIFKALGDAGKTESERLWLGCDRAFKLVDGFGNPGNVGIEGIADQIIELSESHSYLFAEKQDCSIYSWLEELACYSPIIHLQQTDGKVSAHWPFTAARNEIGIIEGKKVLEAIKSSFNNPDRSSLPRVDRIYLTIEVFSSTGSINYYTLKDLEETVRYWRQFVPVDGTQPGFVY